MNSSFQINKEEGLAFFPRLENRFGIRNAVTWDNVIWGNMNDGFASSEEDLRRIKNNDLTLAEHMDVSRVLASKTPIDATISYIDDATADYLLRKELFQTKELKTNLISANAVVLTARAVSVVFAPRDCAIVSIVHPSWKGTLLMHIGAHMILQNLHYSSMLLFQKVLPYSIAECEGFITPHICVKHYTIDENAYRRFIAHHKNVAEFLKKSHDDRYHFDYIGYMKQELSQKFKLKTWHDSGICNYESAENGNLYSKKLTDRTPESFPKASFNVAYAISTN